MVERAWQPQCLVPGCDGKAHAWNVCRAHYDRNQYLKTTWAALNQRCHQANSKDYRNYGARGITVCPEWRHDFVAFALYALQTLGERPPGYTIDRIDNDGGYCPGNIRWATRKEQAANKRPMRPRAKKLRPLPKAFADWMVSNGYPMRPR